MSSFEKSVSEMSTFAFQSRGMCIQTLIEIHTTVLQNSVKTISINQLINMIDADF